MSGSLSTRLEEDDEDDLATVLIDQVRVSFDEDTQTPHTAPQRETASPLVVSPAPIELPRQYAPVSVNTPSYGSMDPAPPLPSPPTRTPTPEPDPSPTHWVEVGLAAGFVAMGAGGLALWLLS